MAQLASFQPAVLQRARLGAKILCELQHLLVEPAQGDKRLKHWLVLVAGIAGLT